MSSTNCENSLNSNPHPDLKNCCRICMEKKLEMLSLFAKIEQNDGDGVFATENLSDKVMFCCDLQITDSDGFPSKICRLCLSELQIAYKFKSKCIESDKHFRKMLLKYEIKDEQPDYSISLDELNYLCDSDSEDKIEVSTKKELDDPENNLKVLNSVLGNGNDASEKRHSEKKKSRIRGRLRACKNLVKPGLKVKELPKPEKILRTDPLLCIQCDMKFPTKIAALQHRRSHTPKVNWVCEICGKVFEHRASQYSHMRSHFPPRFNCDQCDYKTWHKHDLAKHSSIHSGVKQYQCEFCTAAYHVSSNLSQHIKRSHQGLKNFSCHVCERRFFDRTKLLRHIDSHNDIKRFSCESCGSAFTRRCYWTRHMFRQHGVIIKTPRPGRQKTNYVVGCEVTKDSDINIAIGNIDNCSQNVVL